MAAMITVVPNVERMDQSDIDVPTMFWWRCIALSYCSILVHGVSVLDR